MRGSIGFPERLCFSTVWLTNPLLNPSLQDSQSCGLQLFPRTWQWCPQLCPRRWVYSWFAQRERLWRLLALAAGDVNPCGVSELHLKHL